MKTFLISVGRRLRAPLLIAIGLILADVAAADPIITVTDTQSDAELVAEIEAIFGPSMPWTTASNLATIDYWLSLVPAAAESESLDTYLGIVTEQADASGALPVDTASNDGSLSTNPEPATLVLLGSGLFSLLWGATTISSIRRRSNTS